MQRASSAPHRSIAGQEPTENPRDNPELWVQLGEETRSTNLAILETVQELKNEIA